MTTASASPSNRDRARPIVRAEALFRLGLLFGPARLNGSLLVTEFPKSGGTWLSELVADAGGLSFPQNRFPSLGRSVFHGHYRRPFPGVRTLVLWRDPRDIVVSWYYHSLLSGHSHRSLIARTRDDLRFDDLDAIRENLPAFIDYMFNRQRAPGFNWNQFFDAWSASAPLRAHTSYERLSVDTERELARVLELFGIEPTDPLPPIVERHSFEVKAGRSRGVARSDSFLRKGVAGGWRDSFSADAEAMLERCTQGRVGRWQAFIDELAP